MSSTPSPAPLTRHEIEAKIARRAWADEAFRAEFLADPAAAFVKYAGVPAARLPRLVVHEEQPGTWHIVLPARPAATGELSDEELEKVAGGTDLVATISVAIVTAVVGAVSIHTAMAAGGVYKDDAW